MANGNGETNGNSIKINTAILIWLGGLTICGVFYAGMSLERLNTIKETQAENRRELEEKFRLIDLRLENDSANIKALTIGYTRGQTDQLIKPSFKLPNGGQ